MVTPDVKTASFTSVLTVLALTFMGVAAAVIDPQLAGSTRPQPTLTGSLSDWLSILGTNLRVLAVPFLLAALRFPATRLGRILGDLVVAAFTAFSTLTVGVAIGRWRGRLIPYLPHLPLEWLALSLALAAWLLIRTGHARLRQLAELAVVIVVLLTSAAAVETWATPHRPARADASTRAAPHDWPGVDGAPPRMPAHAPARSGHTINHRPPGGIA
jgi:hypothetical protein